MKFSILLPHLRPWVLGLVKIWPAMIVKPNFAIWEVFHILALMVLGGASIILSLRLLGAGLTEERPSELYRSLRAWLHAGVVGVVITGILIGMANAERLYDSAAFLVKIIALIAGVVMTYGAARPMLLADGRASRGAVVAALVALAIWGVGVLIFLTGGLITPGLFHVVTAGALIVLCLTRGRTRIIYVAGVALILLAMFLATHVFIAPDDLKRADPANVALGWVMMAWVTGGAVAQVLGSRARLAEPLAPRVVGYATILIWVSAAAAGRWIAFA